jgi:hypothetical protein
MNTEHSAGQDLVDLNQKVQDIWNPKCRRRQGQG